MKLKLSLDPQTVRLLRLEAFGRDCTLSQVITEMVRSIPRRFVLTDRGTKGTVGTETPPLGFTSGASVTHGGTGSLGVVSEAG